MNTSVKLVLVFDVKPLGSTVMQGFVNIFVMGVAYDARGCTRMPTDSFHRELFSGIWKDSPRFRLRSRGG